MTTAQRSARLVLLLVVVSGLGVAAFHPEGSKFAAYASGQRRASGMSVFSVGGNIGYALGPTATTPLVLALGLTGGLLLALAAFGLGGLTLIASLFGLTLGRKDEVTHETIPAEGPKTPTA